MKYFISIIISLFLTLSSLAQEFSIKGSVTGIENATLDLQVLPLKHGATPIFRTIHPANGTFDCTIKADLYMWHLIRIDSKDFEKAFGITDPESDTGKPGGNGKNLVLDLLNQDIVFFIQPGDQIIVQANIESNGIHYQVSGNKIGSQQNAFSSRLYPLEKEMNRLMLQREMQMTENTKNKRREVDQHITRLKSQIEKTELALIRDHPDWEFSAQRLAGYPIDSISRYFKDFTSDVQNSFFGIHLSKILTASDISSRAPRFSLPNEFGEKISSDSFKGKYVVLDFWGSWCGYCIKDFPKLKEYQEKYKDKAEFIYIGCRDDLKVWQTTIDKLDIGGIHLFAEDDEVPDRFGVQGFPTKIIIDNEWKIVFKTIGTDEDFYARMDEIFQLNLNAF